MVSSYTLANPFDLFTVVTGGALLMKKLSEMERHHELRALILTIILTCIAWYVMNCVWTEAGMFYGCGFQNFTDENI